MHMEVFKSRSLWDIVRKTDHLLVFFEVREANKGQLISHKSLWRGECFYVAFVIFNLIKVAGVYVAAQLWDHRGNRWRRSEREEKGKSLNRREKKGKCRVKKSFSLINNLMLYSDAAAVPEEFAAVQCLSDTQRPVFTEAACWTVVTLTVSDGVEGPLVVPEEGVSLDFLHAVSTQSHLPQNKERQQWRSDQI